MGLVSHHDAYADLEPRSVWRYFAEIAAIPRPSKHEERVRAYVREVAQRQGFGVREDQVGNLVIEVPPTEGRGSEPVTVLQAHLDMVCEKNAASRHDFTHDGMRLIVDGDSSSEERIVRADGTTLGADNGIGVALALAAATSRDVIHGPLDLLFTVDEEEGMCGAKALSAAFFRGRRLLNLDSEEEGTLYIGCAGGCDLNLTWTLDAVPLLHNAEVCRVSITGLRGGHSGVDIHEGRGNAIKLLARTLLREDRHSLQLMDVSGGSKRNAIPREATAVFASSAGSHEMLRKAGADVTLEAMGESFEPDVAVRIERVRTDATPVGIGASDTERVLAALASLPSGVLGMHPKVAGLVETSNNISTIMAKAQGSHIVIDLGMLPRSSSASRMRDSLDQLGALGRLTGAKVSTGNAYPGWSPDPDSPTLAICRRVHQQLFGVEPKVASIHAGLECGIIGERVGNMDMVSLGPTIRGAHSPNERVYVTSVERTWRYLVALLLALVQPSATI